MIRTGILNPHVLSLVARVRHTNTLVIADRGFPSWPGLETVDLSLVDDVPTVAQVVSAILANWTVGHAFMAEEFLKVNPAGSRERIAALLGAVPCEFEPHVQFKLRVPRSVGLIRTGDTTQYANMILESA